MESLINSESRRRRENWIKTGTSQRNSCSVVQMIFFFRRTIIWSSSHCLHSDFPLGKIVRVDASYQLTAFETHLERSRGSLRLPKWDRFWSFSISVIRWLNISSPYILLFAHTHIMLINRWQWPLLVFDIKGVVVFKVKAANILLLGWKLHVSVTDLITMKAKM